MTRSKAVLIILDGFGLGKDSPTNAISRAAMPFYRQILKDYPHSRLMTHGGAVGLPDGIMGNSEVGHMTMGSGRIIYQDLMRINHAIRDGEFEKNPALNDTLDRTLAAGGRIHLMGLLSDGGVHSHLDHLYALVDLCRKKSVSEVLIHPFLDGRDTPPDSSIGYLKSLLAHDTMSAQGQTRVRIASVMGRYWAMDRDNRTERTEKAYQTLCGKTSATGDPDDAQTGIRAVEQSHSAGKMDEFVEPLLLLPDGGMKDGDGIIFFNFRSDRARQISRMILDEKNFKPSAFASMTEYASDLKTRVAFLPSQPENIFGSCLEKKGLTQFRIAETEKYAHVTFFFNGGREKPFQGENRVLIPSPREVATYDLKPEMSALQVAERAATEISSGTHDFVVMNFANADMVGHTGKMDAAVRAMETLDQCLKRVFGAAEKAACRTLLTADHGNAEEMCHSDGKPHTQHTLNPVPAVLVDPGTANAPKSSRARLEDGTLADIMPTLCEMMGLDAPSELTGRSLIRGSH